MVQCQCLTNCTPTPLLIQQQWTNNKFWVCVGLWEGQVRSFSHTDTDRNGFSSRRFFGSQVSANTKCKTCMLLTFSRWGTLTFLSLEAVAKYLSSSLQAHDQIILACWFFLSLRATRLKSWPVTSTKKWNKQITEHSSLIVRGVGGFGGYRRGRNLWFSGRTKGGSVEY